MVWYDVYKAHHWYRDNQTITERTRRTRTNVANSTSWRDSRNVPHSTSYKYHSTCTHEGVVLSIRSSDVRALYDDDSRTGRQISP